MIIQAKKFAAENNIDHKMVTWALKNGKLPGLLVSYGSQEGKKFSGWCVYADEVTDEQLEDAMRAYYTKDEPKRRPKSGLRQAMIRLQDYNTEHKTNYSYGEAVVRGII